MTTPSREDDIKTILWLAGDDSGKFSEGDKQVLRRVAARLAAIEAGDHDDGKPVSPWRPMDEAPRDGSEFQALATVDANGAWIWEPRCRFEPKNEVFEIWGRVDYDQDGWEVHPLITLQSWQSQPVLPPPPTGSGE